jgi:hypothetical protein
MLSSCSRSCAALSSAISCQLSSAISDYTQYHASRSGLYNQWHASPALHALLPLPLQLLPLPLLLLLQATPHVTGAVALYAATYMTKPGNEGKLPPAAQTRAAVLNTGTLSSLYEVSYHCRNSCTLPYQFSDILYRHQRIVIVVGLSVALDATACHSRTLLCC